MDENLLRIGEFAAFHNISVKAVRLYEKKGIITPAYVDPQTGYRYYSADQVQQINALMELRSLGFTLAEVRRILKGHMTGDQLLDALTNKRLAWLDRIANAQYHLSAIDSIAGRIRAAGPELKITQLTDEQRAWLLVKLVCVEDLAAQSTLSEAIWL